MQRAVIISGGELGAWALDYIHKEDYLIAADRGALFAVQHNLCPHISLGDFDSVEPAEMTMIQLHSKQVVDCDPVWKNLTDTEMAFEHALQLDIEELIVLGSTGSRLDHTLANIHLLSRSSERGLNCTMVDRNNEIKLITGASTIIRGPYTYISLLPLTGEVSGITLTGFKYPLQNATLKIGQSLGISNQLISDTGSIDIATGRLLVIQSRD